MQKYLNLQKKVCHVLIFLMLSVKKSKATFQLCQKMVFKNVSIIINQKTDTIKKG
jgi:hypothetical protein